MTPSFRRFIDHMTEVVTVAVQTGKDPHLVAGGDWYWQAFFTLAKTRQIGPNGYQPLTLQDLYHWQAIGGLRMTLKHFEVLLAMDEAFLKALRARNHPARSTKSVEPSPINPALFDAIT